MTIAVANSTEDMKTMTKGFTFGNFQLYQLQKYYRGWIDRTLFAAWKLPIGPRERGRIMQLKDSVDPPKVEDPGLIGGSLQKEGLLSRRDDKIACLIVMVINLIQVWHECNEEYPGRVEDLLIELDHIIEEWAREEVVGSIRTGFKLEVK